MALDPRYVVTSDLESYFVDKDSGEPLSGGIVTFYSDLDRSVKKPVYQLTGSPPNYTYAPLPNPCILSIVGTFQDELGNNIVPYYYPYNDSGNLELYYITVQNSGFVAQFTREGWPNDAAGSGGDSTIDNFNYIPNGQFLAHNDIVSATQPPVETYAFGAQTLVAQAIAQGGWFFIHNSGGTGTYDNSFERLPAGVGLNDFPRYAFNFKSTSVGNDQTRDLQIRWPDVNKFSAGNPPGVQDFTFTFSAQSNTGASYSFNVYLIRYFGTGGAPSVPTETPIGTINVTPAVGYKRILITGIEGNLGTIGTNNDDFIAIDIRGLDSNWDVQITDATFLAGNLTVNEFPIQTNASMLSEGVTGWMPTPDPDGFDLYLPLVLTPTGMTFDRSLVGEIVPFMDAAAPGNNHLLCDGSSYLTADYSAIGIPYRRLFDKLYNTTYKAPITGTGYQFMTAYADASSTQHLRITTNQPGLQTAASDAGGSTVGFRSIHVGQATSNLTSYMITANTVVIKGSYIGSINIPTAGTSGFTMTSSRNLALGFQISTIQAVAAVGLAGLYFTFHSSDSNTVPSNDSYYMWFTVDGSGADPSPGGTGFKVELLSSYTAAQVAQCVREAIIGAQQVDVIIPNAASISQSSYFSIFANSQQYIVWYNKDNGGTEPNVGSAKYIEVDIAAADSAATVTTATLVAINSAAVGVPDLRGMSLRGLDNTTTPRWDINVNSSRLSPLSNTTGASAVLDSIEIDTILSHQHLSDTNAALITAGGVQAYQATAGGASGLAIAGSATAVGSNAWRVITGLEGQNETRGVNTAVNWYMKY